MARCWGSAEPYVLVRLSIMTWLLLSISVARLLFCYPIPSNICLIFEIYSVTFLKSLFKSAFWGWSRILIGLTENIESLIDGALSKDSFSCFCSLKFRLKTFKASPLTDCFGKSSKRLSSFSLPRFCSSRGFQTSSSWAFIEKRLERRLPFWSWFYSKLALSRNGPDS